MNFRKKLDDILGWSLIAIMVVLVCNVVWQVVSRYILSNPSSFTDELARYLLIWVGVLGAAYASGKKLHLAIELLPSRLNERQKIALNTIIYSLVALFALSVMIIGGSRLVYITLRLGQTSAALKLPLGILYTIIPLSGLIIVYYSLDDILNQYKERRTS